MESNKNSKKIVSLGIILLIIAGIIVVALKGFNVSLMFGNHEVIEVRVGKEVNIDIVNKICREVFQDKKYVAKELEVFGESFQINVDSITDEEKANLLTKINEKFETEKTVDDLKISTVSNKRIRDVVKPYVAPMVISVVVVFVYMLIRFRKVDGLKIIIDYATKVILLNAILFSIIAITRIEVSDFIINFAMLITIAMLVYYIAKSEKKIQEIPEEQG